MQPANQQLVFQHQPAPPPPHPGVISNQNNPDRNKWGWKVRNVMGILQIAFGVIEMAFGIAVICIPIRYYDDSDSVAWGVWNGLFAIVTGCFGVYSKRRKCMIIAYMVTSIVGAVMSSCCAVWAADMISHSTGDGKEPGKCCTNVTSGETLYTLPSVTEHHSDMRLGDNFGLAIIPSSQWWRIENRGAHLALYSILCIVFAMQLLISILGASFTCRPVCSSKPHEQVVYYYVAQAPPQQAGPLPPSYMMTTPPQYNVPYGNAPCGGPPLHYNTSNVAENSESSKTPL